MRVVVIGAGVTGVSTAYCIHRDVPGAEVTIVSDSFTPHTVSDISPGLWKPHPLDKNPLHLQKKWGNKTFEHLDRIHKTEDAADCGVALVSGYLLYDKFEPRPFWADRVYGFRSMTDEELRRYPGHTHGHALTTYLCESLYYLPYLTKKFKELGGRILEKKLLHIEEVFSEADIVVNCAGIGAHHLVNDKDLYPIKGHLLRAKAPWVKHFAVSISDLSDAHYLPGRDYVVMGGIHREGDWDTKANENDTKRIIQGCIDLMPSLKHAKVVNSRVGLRPGRSKVRLELEWRKYGTKSKAVVHNYGHGGSGVTFHWGCALDATELVQEAITQSQQLQSKL